MEDTLYIEDPCEGWSADDRRSVIEQLAAGGRDDIVWATLPYVRDRVSELQARASSIAWLAEQRRASRCYQQRGDSGVGQRDPPGFCATRT